MLAWLDDQKDDQKESSRDRSTWCAMRDMLRETVCSALPPEILDSKPLVATKVTSRPLPTQMNSEGSTPSRTE